MRTLVVVLLALVGLGAVSSITAPQEPPKIAVERPWARASIGVSRPAAAYLTVVNHGSEAVRLVGIETPAASRAEVHRTFTEGEVVRMEPVRELPVQAGQRVVLAPGGLHIMLMDLKQPLEKGSTFPLALRFANGRMIEIAVPVLGPGARGPAE